MTHLEEELNKLRGEMIEMSNLVASQIEKSLTALVEEDVDLAREVIFNEKRVNAMELSIDKDCENILALLNPFASDMRFVFATLKINTNFERIGDSAEGIAKYILQSGKCFEEELLNDCRFNEMADIVKEMLHAIGKAYEESDAKLARTVFKQDMILDEINKASTDNIALYINKRPENVYQALYLLTVIRKLERVGDHITNIAEEIIFHLEAKVLKHIKKSVEEDE
ncbi:phosphate signaling complex protein PhoU [Desertivirga arenae]|uniref:phosphate signaling complex protein PhoU n=1 Tax=Desertivirga arenae TaxID=2810309 RepID=UPI001A96C7A1|nr:phosphate signaling complex protein PhoU [Pedobacter sp. SYSU D00823]